MKYHYVYRITNTCINKHYYGKRSSSLEPHKDLGKHYFSSSRDKEFIKDQKENPEKYRYKVIRIFEFSQDALVFEILLHQKFNVGINPNFYNKAKQTSSGFSTFGIKPSESTLLKLQKSSTGRKHSLETKQKQALSKYGNTWNIGRKHSQEAINKMKKIKGHVKGNIKPVNIYCFETNKLIAQNVILHEWCGQDKSLRSNLAATLKRDISNPSSKYNPHQSKGYFAEYV